jgi:hypothetical protein
MTRFIDNIICMTIGTVLGVIIGAVLLMRETDLEMQYKKEFESDISFCKNELIPMHSEIATETCIVLDKPGKKCSDRAVKYNKTAENYDPLSPMWYQVQIDKRKNVPSYCQEFDGGFVVQFSPEKDGKCHFLYNHKFSERH